MTNPTRQAFRHLTDAQYNELLADIATGTAEQKANRHTLYVRALAEAYGNNPPAVGKALAELLYWAAFDAVEAHLEECK